MDSLQAAMGAREPASTGPPTGGPRRPLRSSAVPLRIRSDEELVRRFRAGDEDAFRVIHDRYRARLFAYARQMLRGSRQDAEEALQDAFVRAHAALRTDARDISLRAWLYRIVHNRCIDELRRPQPPSPESLALLRPPPEDPIAATLRRESLRRLVTDIGRLPEQQRAALLMRELGGMSYDEVAAALTITVASVKSTLMRARMSLTTAAQARGAACHEIRTQLAAAHERGVRFDGLVRRHLHDCDACRAYRRELQATARRLAALAPALGPGALFAKLLGGASLLGGGAGAASSIGGGAAAGGASAGGGLLSLTGGQLAALAAAGAIGIGGGIVALEDRSGSTPQRHPAHQTLTVARSTSAVLANVPLAQRAPQPRHPQTTSRHPRSESAAGRPRARPAWATPRYPGLRKQIARIRGFHLVWRDGALEPAGLASAPRDPQARAQWVDTAMVQWLVSSVEGRRLLARMQHLPRGVVITIEPGGTWSSRTELAGRTEATRLATGLAGSMWLTGTPQGRRAMRRLREQARRRANAQPAPPTATTPTEPAPVDTTTQPAPPPATTPTTPAPAVTTTQPQPPPATTTEPAPAPAVP
ncbi:MAG TPA: RNA polymerase sigma factor [Conexibacter sp.]|jgi:RNA polymerase sigma factor (sigma-70 family)|nr:RNA polymerase sigma factor [Conexibacter sp.]